MFLLFTNTYCLQWGGECVLFESCPNVHFLLFGDPQACGNEAVGKHWWWKATVPGSVGSAHSPLLQGHHLLTESVFFQWLPSSPHNLTKYANSSISWFAKLCIVSKFSLKWWKPIHTVYIIMTVSEFNRRNRTSRRLYLYSYQAIRCQSSYLYMHV